MNIYIIDFYFDGSKLIGWLIQKSKDYFKIRIIVFYIVTLTRSLFLNPISLEKGIKTRINAPMVRKTDSWKSHKKPKGIPRNTRWNPSIPVIISPPWFSPTGPATSITGDRCRWAAITKAHRSSLAIVDSSPRERALKGSARQVRWQSGWMANRTAAIPLPWPWTCIPLARVRPSAFVSALSGLL